MEVGCGSARMLAEQATHVRFVAGLDLSDIQVAMASKRLAERIAAGTAEIVKGDMALPWADGRFSVVGSLNCLKFVPDPLKALIEMHRSASRRAARAHHRQAGGHVGPVRRGRRVRPVAVERGMMRGGWWRPPASATSPSLTCRPGWGSSSFVAPSGRHHRSWRPRDRGSRDPTRAGTIGVGGDASAMVPDARSAGRCAGQSSGVLPVTVEPPSRMTVPSPPSWLSDVPVAPARPTRGIAVTEDDWRRVSEPSLYMLLPLRAVLSRTSDAVRVALPSLMMPPP